MIAEEFPNVMNPDWNVILRDDDIFGRILKDILKVDQMEPGRSGPRPNLDYQRGMQTWREMTGQDYSELPFHEAFAILTRNNSLRTIARKTHISRSKVHRLLSGEDQPTVDDLRSIAEAYGKKPAYFVEYRAEFIMAAIAARLVDETEMTVTLYTKIVRAV
jgi:transcriptional regulator with XRE-family HTH domain